MAAFMVAITAASGVMRKLVGVVGRRLVMSRTGWTVLNCGCLAAVLSPSTFGFAKQNSFIRRVGLAPASAGPGSRSRCRRFRPEAVAPF